jgi:hypothetical protein
MQGKRVWCCQGHAYYLHTRTPRRFHPGVVVLGELGGRRPQLRRGPIAAVFSHEFHESARIYLRIRADLIGTDKPTAYPTYPVHASRFTFHGLGVMYVIGSGPPSWYAIDEDREKEVAHVTDDGVSSSFRRLPAATDAIARWKARSVWGVLVHGLVVTLTHWSARWHWSLPGGLTRC